MAPTQPRSLTGPRGWLPPRSERQQAQADPNLAPTHTPMSRAQLDEFRNRIRDQQLRGYEPRDFQLRLAQAQEEGQGVICQAPTGAGKTLVASAPYALEKNAGKTTLMVSPLIALMNEMAMSFEKDYGVSATALNSSTSSVDIKGTSQLKRILDGEFRVVLLSPEMLASKPFTDCVLRNRRFHNRIYSVIVDEAHCISFWGAEFRKSYGTIGFIRAFLPRDTPIIAVSATLTPRVARAVIDTLQFTRNTTRPYLHLNIGNDRPNVSLIVRAMHHPMKTYNDLDFVIPTGVSRAEDIPKTWIYADNIATGQEIIHHLHDLLPEHLHSAVRPFNAVQSEGYRDLAMDLFRQGVIRILVCTDAAGMGCNIPDIVWIIQWRTTQKLSMFVQRAGRAVRALAAGYAVLLVEPTAYSKVIAVWADEAEVEAGATSWRVAKPPTLSATQTTEYAKAHGRGRGAHNGADCFPFSPWKQLPIAPDDETEGMHHFVQTKGCRRLILTDSPAHPTVPCCDTCNPELLDLVRARKKAPGAAAVPKLAYEESKSVELWMAIDDWREDMCERGIAECPMGPECFLPTYIVDKMALLKRDNMRQHAENLLKYQWIFWDRFGQRLVDYVVNKNSHLHGHDNDTSLPIPPTQIPSADLSACTEPVDQPPQSAVSAPDALRSGRGGTAPANSRKRAGTKTANDPAKPKRKRGAPKPREVPLVAEGGVSASEAASSTKRGRTRGVSTDNMRSTKKQKVAEEGAASSRAVGGCTSEVLQPPNAVTSHAQQESSAGGPPARPIAPAPDRCSASAQAARHDGLTEPYAQALPPSPLAAHVRDDADSHAARTAAYRFSGYPSTSQFLRARVERDQSDGLADLRPRREAYPPSTWQQTSTPSMSTPHHSSTSQHALPTPPLSAHQRSSARSSQLGTLATPLSQRGYMVSPDTSHHRAPPYLTDRPTSLTFEHHHPPPPPASSRGGWYTRPSAEPLSSAMTASFFEQPVMQIVDFAPPHGALLKLDAVTLVSKCIVSQLGGTCWIDQTVESGKVRVALSRGQTRIVDVVQRATVICACARGLHGSRAIS